MTVKPEARSSLALDPYEALINNQYANRIRFLQQIGGHYFGDNFRLTSTPTDWDLQLGRYQGKERSGIKIDLHGYWIFKPNANKCWQAVKGRERLQYWNEDGKARGNPEDWELFEFIRVNTADRTIKIRNAHSPFYIGLVRDVFSCNELSNPAIFKVEFP